MALSRCGDILSVDRLLWRLRRGSDSSGEKPIISGEYTWPIRVIWLVMALIFFGAGMSKLRHSDVELGVYLGVGGVAFLCLIYYASLSVWRSMKRI